MHRAATNSYAKMAAYNTKVFMAKYNLHLLM